MAAGETFRLAAQAYQSGDLGGAERYCREILAGQPDHFDALHLLGFLLARKRDFAKAVQLIGKAVRVRPDSTAARINLGNILIQAGRRQEALQTFNDAASLTPENATVYLSRAGLLWNMGRLADAENEFKHAATLKPSDIKALTGLSAVYLEMQRYEDALEVSNRALVAGMDDSTVYYIRASALRALNHPQEALEDLGRVITAAPNYAEAYRLRGAILAEMNRAKDAVSDFTRARSLGGLNTAFVDEMIAAKRLKKALDYVDLVLAAEPENAVAYNCRGAILKEIGDAEQALQSLDRAIELEPALPEIHFNRGIVLHLLGRIEQSLEEFNQAIALNPFYIGAYYNRNINFRMLERFEEAYADCEKILSLDPQHSQAMYTRFLFASQFCIWRDYRFNADNLKTSLNEKHQNEPFVLLRTFDDPALHLQAARTKAEPLGDVLKQSVSAPRKRLRIAYLSADFDDHPVAHQAIELFERHDLGRFETYGICTHFRPPQSAIRNRLKGAFEHFIEVGKEGNLNIAKTLASLQIDIAIELGGYTSRARPVVFSWRPAPVAVTYLGYPGTLGADYIDYIIADRQVIPMGSEEYYAEKVVRLPDCFMPIDTRGWLKPAAPTRREAGLPDVGFVFCAFNNAFKLTPELFDVWMRLLHTVEDSILWLNINGQKAQNNLHREAFKRGISPERLIFAPRTKERTEHLARLSLADLYLDTFPYGAHATASDFLRMGVPIVTCAGQCFASRVAASMLTVAGLPELIANDFASYEAKALELARNPELLATMRAKAAAAGSSALFDMEKLCRNIEQAYRTMWDRHVKGLSPESFTVGAS